MGRRTKLTPEVQDRILQAVRAGLRYREAALAAGIDERTFYNWKRRGEEAKSGIYFQFFQSLKEAEARGELALLARIQAASQETWQAAAWILERRHRERWGRNLDITSGGHQLIKLTWGDDERTNDSASETA